MYMPRSMARCSSLLVVLIAALVLVGGSQATVSQLIYAYFDVDGGIQFRYADSSNVGSTIPPGTYTINLNNNGADDLGVDHIYHLFGPGVDYKAANVDTQATFTATFQAGATYTAQDDLNPKIHLTMLATNAVPAVTTTTTTPTSTTKKPPAPTSSDIVGSGIVPFRGKLAATVSVAGKLALSTKGKPVNTLRAGLYTFIVVDQSAKRGFSIEKLKSNAIALTGIGYKGTHVKTVDLKAGQWTFFSPGIPKSYFIVNH
jgi:hypothetical protein